MLPLTMISADMTDAINEMTLTVERGKETSDPVETTSVKKDEAKEGSKEKERPVGRLEENDGEENEDRSDNGDDGDHISAGSHDEIHVAKAGEDPEHKAETGRRNKPIERRGEIFETVRKMLNGSNYKYHVDPDRDLIRMTSRGEHAAYNIIFDVKEERCQLIVYVCCHNLVPEEKRTEMAAFMVCANWGLVIGNFEMDMNDGEIRYKVSVDVEEGELSCLMVKNMLGAGTQTMERYFPGIMDVCYAGKGAAESVAKVE